MSETPGSGQFCWNELMTSNAGQAKEFYTNLFGWSVQENKMSNMTYTMFTQGEKMIGGMLQIPDELKGKVPSHWMSYVMVSNLEEMQKKATSLGATVAVPITPIEGFGRFTVLADPTGAPIALWEVNQQQ